MSKKIQSQNDASLLLSSLLSQLGEMKTGENQDGINLEEILQEVFASMGLAGEQEESDDLGEGEPFEESQFTAVPKQNSQEILPPEDEEECEECQEVSLDELLTLVADQEEQLKLYRRKLKKSLVRLREMSEEVRSLKDELKGKSIQTQEDTKDPSFLECSSCRNSYIYIKDREKKMECPFCETEKAKRLSEKLYTAVTSLKYIGETSKDRTLPFQKTDLESLLKEARENLAPQVPS